MRLYLDSASGAVMDLTSLGMLAQIDVQHFRSSLRTHETTILEILHYLFHRKTLLLLRTGRLARLLDETLSYVQSMESFMCAGPSALPLDLRFKYICSVAVDALQVADSVFSATAIPASSAKLSPMRGTQFTHFFFCKPG